MKSVIVGTAGHIDHGKTALVKALTGIDADRLEEEKRRGITIDLGFAHAELPSPSGEPLRLGFIDVPGHERFVRNMLAGVGGLDLVLLVVAADEGVKPQTREHFDISRLLAVQRGIVVVTKSDLVDADTLQVVRTEVAEFVRGSFLEAAPIVAVSSQTGAGMDELRRELATIAAEASARDSSALFRLPIDRVFVMKGFGTVVTGTLVAGAVAKDDEVELLPQGRRLRVRGVQVHGAAAEPATAGQRTALNLAGVAAEELTRGMTLAAPGVLQPTRRADVTLALLNSARPLRDRARVHFHTHTSETVAEVILLADARVAHDPGLTAALKQLAAGGEAFAQLRFDEPLLLLPEDRFIVRQFSPVVTIGGGVVIDPFPLERKPGHDARLTSVVALARGTLGEKLAARVARRGAAGLTVQRAMAEMGLARSAIEGLLPEMMSVIARTGETLVSGAVLARLKSEALETITRYHDSNPLVAGISKEELRERLGASPDVLAAMLASLVTEKKIELAVEQVRAAGRGVVLKDEEAEAKQKIEAAFAGAGLKVPLLKDVLASLPVDRARAQKIITLLLRDRVLVKLGDDLVFHRDALQQMRGRVAARKAVSRTIDVAGFKDLFGLSRKYAIPLLEYLDRERVTKRVGDERVIL
jgi:selenocysteine-specific elongation factor